MFDEFALYQSIFKAKGEPFRIRNFIIDFTDQGGSNVHQICQILEILAVSSDEAVLAEVEEQLMEDSEVVISIIELHGLYSLDELQAVSDGASAPLHALSFVYAREGLMPIKKAVHMDSTERKRSVEHD